MEAAFGQKVDLKSEYISKSVDSFESETISYSSSDQELSRNVFVASILFTGAISYVTNGPGHDPENLDFHEF